MSTTPTHAPTVSVVIIDDNAGSLEMLSAALSAPGLTVFTAQDPEDGLELIYGKHPQIVVTDLVMPKMSGIEVLERVMEFDPATDVILMTAHYTSETAVEAIKKGASDYLNKPVPIAVLREKIGKMVAEARRRQHALQLEDELASASAFQGLVGRSPLMWDVFARVRRIAAHYRTALVTGETGTGKDLVAQALHRLSPAAQGHFVVLNCSAVVETLFESELFGHAKGAFTGAVADKAGLFEHAHEGTLFLDEIGDMPMTTQAKLLRALQNQEIQRVGSLWPRKVNARVIAATNRDLRAAVKEARFREDLYYRLSMLEIHLPLLEQRPEDLPLLERHFISKFNAIYGRNIRGLTQRAAMVLASHSWPGNVRELENTIGHACIMTLGDIIDVADLPDYLRAPAHEGKFSAPLPPAAPDSVVALEEQERLSIQRALEAAGGNQSQAARLLRIGRDALRYKMKKHGLQ
jgi:DNA-binding NtrC family response regulator